MDVVSKKIKPKSRRGRGKKNKENKSEIFVAIGSNAAGLKAKSDSLRKKG